MVKKLHERVKNQIENQTKVYSTKGNRGRKELVLNEGDRVWLHLRKDRFNWCNAYSVISNFEGVE